MVVVVVDLWSCLFHSNQNAGERQETHEGASKYVVFCDSSSNELQFLGVFFCALDTWNCHLSDPMLV